ncbi:cytochrome-b5 reductase [Nematocida sp. AWRm77]|nr:cytochrome-b5 reductase [Nematocida sp. AWRm77]
MCARVCLCRRLCFFFFLLGIFQIEAEGHMQSTLKEEAKTEKRVEMEELEGTITRVVEMEGGVKEYHISVGKDLHPEPCYVVRLGVPKSVLTRPYTPVHVGERELVCRIKIYKEKEEREEGGAGEREMLTPLLAKCSVGDVLRVLWYAKKFPIAEILSDEYKHVCMISAGTGVTPMMQVLEHANKHKDRKRTYFSVCFNRLRSGTLLKSSKEYPEIDLGVEDIITSQESMPRKKALDALKQILIAKKAEEGSTVYLVCGPDTFVAEVAGERKGAYGGMLKDLGVQQKDCYKF